MKPLAVYLHFPFCKKKCNYCTYYSTEFNNNLLKKYITAINKQISQVDECFRDYTLYLGGGTPSLLELNDLNLIVNNVKNKFKGNNIEATIEVNPESVKKEKIKAYHELGFNRISMGVQSLNDLSLKQIGRIHDLETVYKALDILSESKINNLSIDLITGLPSQKIRDLRVLEDLLNKYPIKHISVYNLILEPDLKIVKEIKEGLLELPDEEFEILYQDEISVILKKFGFKQYEIASWSKPGFESRHNLAYWDLSPYIGFGPTASSYLNSYRITYSANLDYYLNNFFLAEKHFQTIKEAKQEFMFLGLRRINGVNDYNYRNIFNSSFFDDFNLEINQLIKKGLLKRKNQTLYLTNRGLNLANLVFSEFV